MELCPLCETALAIKSAKYVIREDKLYMVQEMTCRNPKCDNYGQVVDTIEHELEVSKE